MKKCRRSNPELRRTSDQRVLEELESNNPGAKAALTSAIAAYRVSASVAIRVGVAIAAEDLLNMFRMPLIIMVDPSVTNPNRENPKKSHPDCLINRDTGNCVI